MHRFSRPSVQTSFRANRPLTAGEISYYAPSVLANEAHESRGERYTYIPTGDVLQALSTHDFLPYEVRQTKVRDQDRREHTKHMVRLRHASADIRTGEVPEIILVNSHDGTSSYQIMAGFFRMVCSNGLIAGDINTDVRVRHSGDVVGDVIEGSFEVLQNLQEIERRKESYKAIELLPKEQLILAEEAVKLRWGEESTINPRRLLEQIAAARRQTRSPQTASGVVQAAATMVAPATGVSVAALPASATSVSTSRPSTSA